MGTLYSQIILNCFGVNTIRVHWHCLSVCEQYCWGVFPQSNSDSSLSCCPHPLQGELTHLHMSFRQCEGQTSCGRNIWAPGQSLHRCAGNPRCRSYRSLPSSTQWQHISTEIHFHVTIIKDQGWDISRYWHVVPRSLNFSWRHKRFNADHKTCNWQRDFHTFPQRDNGCQIRLGMFWLCVCVCVCVRE